MKSDIVYVEKANGSNHDGEAWIGKCTYSKSGLSIYFDGRGFKRQKGFSSNYYDLDTGEYYWISKVKTNGEDRHEFGKGIIKIDKNIVEEYLQLIKQDLLEKSKFQVVELDNIPAKEKVNQIENEKLDEPEFDFDLRFRNSKDLSDSQIDGLIDYYENLDFQSIHKKARKEWLNSLEGLRQEQFQRMNSNLA